MSQITVRCCHPYAPIATEELQRWLIAEVQRLREEAPEAAVRLLRLTQPGPEGEVGETCAWLGLQPSVLQAARDETLKA